MVSDSLSISDQDALDFPVGEPSKTLYRASKRRLLNGLADRRESGLIEGCESSLRWEYLS